MDYRKLLAVFVLLPFLGHAQASDDPILKCQNGNAKSCYNLGYVSLTGFMNVKVDEKKALEFLNLGCDYNGKSSCFLLGNIYEKGRGKIKANRQSAFRFYDKACNLEDKRSCVLLGLMHLNDKDIDKALTSFDRACELKDGFAFRRA